MSDTEELDLGKDLRALVHRYGYKLTASVLVAIEELVEVCEDSVEGECHEVRQP